MIAINIIADAKFPFDRTQLREHNAGISKFRLTDKIEVDVQVVGTQDE